MPENNDSSEHPLEWQDETLPVSTRFDDPYYSRVDGLAETRHVFLTGNDLARRFADCSEFTIAELGFGTGLNFLATCQLWAKIAPAHARLTYVSFEMFPLTANEITKALSRWPELNQLSERLIGKWTPDLELCSLELGQVNATIFFGDANIRLPQLDFRADAWFLDGFSPAKNPELWNETLMNKVATHTKEHGTFATYTSAGWVRRNLETAGFRVSRVPGHAGKRQMSLGTRPDISKNPRF